MERRLVDAGLQGPPSRCQLLNEKHAWLLNRTLDILLGSSSGLRLHRRRLFCVISPALLAWLAFPVRQDVRRDSRAGNGIAGNFPPAGKSRKFVTASHDNYLQIITHFVEKVDRRRVDWIGAQPYSALEGIEENDETKHSEAQLDLGCGIGRPR